MAEHEREYEQLELEELEELETGNREKYTVGNVTLHTSTSTCRLNPDM